MWLLKKKSKCVLYIEPDSLNMNRANFSVNNYMQYMQIYSDEQRRMCAEKCYETLQYMSTDPTCNFIST